MQVQNARISLASERLATQFSRTEENLQIVSAGGGIAVELRAERVTESARLEYASYGPGARGRAPAAAPLRPLSLAPLQLAVPLRSTPGTVIAPTASAAVQPRQSAVAAAGSTDGELLLLALLIEILSGREIEIARVEAGTAPASLPSPTTLPASGPAQQFSVDYSFSAYYRETEQTRMRATGTIETADGRRIDFNLQIEMLRSYESSTTLSFQAGQRKDPLVLDLGGLGVPQLDPVRVSFDLDADGTAEQIAFVTGSSAFLALDVDASGRIGDGRELFGARSGDGFADLATYDADGNDFIDGNDPVFERLLAWSKNPDGSDSLQGLTELGIGALYLGSTATPFELRGPGNDPLGAVRRSGLYLTEDGRAGALQQLDLVV